MDENKATVFALAYAIANYSGLSKEDFFNRVCQLEQDFKNIILKANGIEWVNCGEPEE